MYGGGCCGGGCCGCAMCGIAWQTSGPPVVTHHVDLIPCGTIGTSLNPPDICCCAYNMPGSPLD
eukprot:8817408-Prorocentrum_lima.AAC.1